MAKTPEGEIKEKIKAYLRELGAMWYMVPQGLPGSTPGAPDMVIIYKGHTWHTEVKTPVGRLSEDQVRVRKKILAQGADYMIVRSVDDVKAFMEALE